MQRYFVSTKEENYLILESSDVHHIKNVMRNKVGDKIECIYNKNLYICELEDLNSPKVKIIEEQEYNNSVEVLPYEQRVVNRIREVYSVDDELALLRQRDTKPEEFERYNVFVERIKAEEKVA